MDPLALLAQFWVKAVLAIALGLAPGLWLGAEFEHRPAGWPNLSVNLVFWHPVIHLPDGPFARLDAQRTANAAAFGLERANFLIVDQALRDQNGRVRAWGALGSSVSADNALAVQRFALGQNQAKKQIATVSAALPTTSDLLARYQAADRQLLEALK